MAHARIPRRFLLDFHREITARIYTFSCPATRFPCRKSHLFSRHSHASTKASTSAVEEKPSPPEVDISTRLRLHMRNIPHPVAVITASDGTSLASSKGNSAFDGFYGVTVSSFSTVTLGPPPIVTFNLREPSRSLDAIMAQGFFRVHTLAGNASGRDTAHAFVRLEHANAFRELDEAGVEISTTGNDAVPTIGGQGVLASLLCRNMPDKMVEVGDHKVIIAEVLDMSSWESGPPDNRADVTKDTHGDGPVGDPGLLYVQQRYGIADVSSMSSSKARNGSGEE